MCLTMLFPFFRADNPVETLVAIVDVILQVFVFAGNLPVDTGLYVLISLAFWQTGNVSRCNETRRQ
jgi:hypothetical protein